MSYRFKLQLTRVQCLNEQVLEWGKDEMHLYGFAISRKGHLFATGYRGLGSYGSDDVRTTAPLPMTLCEGELEDDGLEVLLYFWLVEEDGGGVSRAATRLDGEFREAYQQQARQLLDIRFPRDCIPFTAFYKTVTSFQGDLDDAASGGRDDDVFLPVDVLLDWGSDGTNSVSYSKEFQIERSKRLGHYRLTLRYSYKKIPVVVG